MKAFCLSLFLSLTGAAALPATSPEPFPDGCHYGAIGDSITHHGRYPIYIDLFYLTRFPDRVVDVANFGIAGDTATGTLKRFPWDIAPRHLQAASVMLGMNDVQRELYGMDSPSDDILKQRRDKLDLYEKSLRALVAALRQEGTAVVLLTPSIYDEASAMPGADARGVDGALGECARRVAALGAEQNLPVVDFQGPMREISRRVQAADPAATIIGPDRIHPGPAGHLVMAYLFLKAQHVPGDVDRVAIRAGDGTVARSENCQVTEGKAIPGGVSFSCLAGALPFPVEDAARKGLDWVPFTDELNRETVEVDDLPAGTYTLNIDGQRVRDYSAQELAAGVNLAMEENSPAYRQSRQVLALCAQRWDRLQQLRDIAMVEYQATPEAARPLTLEQVKPLLNARLRAAAGKPWEAWIRQTGDDYLVKKSREADLAAEADRLALEIRQAAVPRPHRIEIRKAS